MLPIPASSDNTAKARGIRVHHILEHALRAHLSLEKIQTYIAGLEVSSDDRESINQAVQTVLTHPVLKAHPQRILKTEVGVKGYLENRFISGIMDLLILSQDEKPLWILDYKTGRFQDTYRKAPPVQYQQQMTCYQKLMQKRYPDYTINIGLIWTDIGWLQLL